VAATGVSASAMSAAAIAVRGTPGFFATRVALAPPRDVRRVVLDDAADPGVDHSQAFASNTCLVLQFARGSADSTGFPFLIDTLLAR
jgi:pimeloyl-ACP methyl ester carboxylesterase